MSPKPTDDPGALPLLEWNRSRAVSEHGIAATTYESAALPATSSLELLPYACEVVDGTLAWESDDPIRISEGAMTAGQDLLKFAGRQRFQTMLADPPWRFQNRTGKMAPEHRRLSRYGTMTVEEICALPVGEIVAEPAHLYLWVPNALLPEGLQVLRAWGFDYKSNIVWHKIRKDGGPDGRGVGFYFRNVTELILFGVRGKNGRTLAPGRRQVNFMASRKREHSRKPDEQYEIIEACSPGPYIELFSRGTRPGWACWGNEAHDDYQPSWATYRHHSRATLPVAAE